MADSTSATPEMSNAEAVTTVLGSLAQTALSIVAPGFNGKTVQALVILAAHIPDSIHKIIALLRKGNDATLSDVEDAFASLKPYSAYGIPDKV